MIYIWNIRKSTVLILITLGIFCSQAVHAQVMYDSGSPVSQMLVGDINVAQTSPEASTGLAIENLCPQLATRDGPQRNSQAQTELFNRCGDLTFDNSPQTGSLRQVAAEEMTTQETNIVELSANQLNSLGVSVQRV